MGDVEALREEQVVLSGGVNVGDAPFVAQNFNGLSEAGRRQA
jgi:hypothetical protein